MKMQIFVNKYLNKHFWNKKNIVKLDIIVIIQGNIDMLRIVYTVLKKITLVFHNGFNYDYHFIRKQKAEEFKKNNLLV